MFHQKKTKTILFVLTLIIGSIGLYLRQGISDNLSIFNSRIIPQHSNVQQQEYYSNNAERTMNKSMNLLKDAIFPSSKRKQRIKMKIIGAELLLKQFNSSDSKSIEYDIMNMVKYCTIDIRTYYC